MNILRPVTVVWDGLKFFLRRTRFGTGFWLLVLAVYLSSPVFNTAPDENMAIEKVMYESDSIAVVEVRGTILTTNVNPTLNQFANATYGTDIRKIMSGLASNNNVKAVLVRFSTPGGTVSGSAMILQALLDLKKHKPVYAYITDISASGGVYSMVGASKIYAQKHAFIGSVGVLMSPRQYFEGVTSVTGPFFSGSVVANKIHTTFIRAGRGKGSGYPFVKPDPKNNAILQGVINRSYNEFLTVIEKHRGIKKSVMRLDYGASIYDTYIAKKIGMIDGVMSELDVKKKLAVLVGLSAKNTTFIHANPVRKQTFWDVMGASVRVGLLGADKDPVKAALAREQQLMLTASALMQ